LGGLLFRFLALFSSTSTSLSSISGAGSPVSINVVVEGQLLSLDDVPLGEDSHPHPFPDDPFGDVAVWIAAVVCESTDSSLFGSVEVLERREVE